MFLPSKQQKRRQSHSCQVLFATIGNFAIIIKSHLNQHQNYLNLLSAPLGKYTNKNNTVEEKKYDENILSSRIDRYTLNPPLNFPLISKGDDNGLRTPPAP